MIRSPLRTAAHLIGAQRPIRRLEDYLDWLDSIAAARQLPPKPRPNGHNPTLGAAYARVDDGRWLADCPAGCGSACDLIPGETRWWCTECANGGTGHTAPLIWPDAVDKLTVNLESLPRPLQFWPCRSCVPRQRDGKDLCLSCQGMQGLEAQP
ncbi:hypothetical protein ETD86_34880 [Nonomuraea turkmeniaca]|uniref:Uncharacterized protein n=1 Tax=Nonomuraea turkmeniaca TaxID=103838 RepID=A0A5S4F637_9ACTN|nr:hypothetical protein [Nonomuraea turkmeniaca]TMR11756.1 hypothetical protein ETD86_34880 [Nonomuraea turkmeniaca]